MLQGTVKSMGKTLQGDERWGGGGEIKKRKKGKGGSYQKGGAEIWTSGIIYRFHDVGGIIIGGGGGRERKC